MDEYYWKDKHYSFFQNTQCECFPCHDVKDPENFNCLFCYCPLYALGKNCGGNFRYTEKGIKDCTNCSLPHARNSYGYVTGKFQDIVKAMQKLESLSENNSSGELHE